MLIAGDPQRRAGRCKQSVLLLTAISLSSRSSLRYRVGAPNMPFVTSRAVGQRALLRQRNRNTDPDRKAVSPALAAGRSMVTLQTRIETLCSSTENVDRTDISALQPAVNAFMKLAWAPSWHSCCDQGLLRYRGGENDRCLCPLQKSCAVKGRRGGGKTPERWGDHCRQDQHAYPRDGHDRTRELLRPSEKSLECQVRTRWLVRRISGSGGYRHVLRDA